MGYLHISNLEKDLTLLMFKEVYCLEKCHGTSAHISYKYNENKLYFFAGGAKHDSFVSIFNHDLLLSKFKENFPDISVVVFGEAYGGKMQGMSKTYGDKLKFIAFDVKVGDVWLNVPNANDVASKLELEFVPYVKTTTDIGSLNAERDKDSEIAVRNGCGSGHKREGIVIRPLIELTTNNLERVIAKYKIPEFGETKTPRVLGETELKTLTDAQAISEEWVTEMRLEHVLDKLPQDIDISHVSLVIKSMIEDVEREASNEIVMSKDAKKYIGHRTVFLFKAKLKRAFEEKVSV